MSILFAILAQATAVAATPSAPSPKPVVIKSLCTSNDPAEVRNAFTFELKQTDGKWSNRVVPVEGSIWPSKAFDVPEPKVDVLPSPRGRALMNTGASEIDGFRYFFVAIAEISERELTDFSIDLSKEPSGQVGGSRAYLKTKCRFTHKAVTNQGSKR